MAKNFVKLAMSLLLIAVTASCVKADEVSELKKMLAEQSLLLKQMENRLNQIESTQTQQEAMVKEEIAKVSSAQEAGIPDSLKWATKMKFKGDLRYRHERIKDDSLTASDETKDRTRHRIRFRLGLEAKVNEEWDVIARLVTGDDDPVSTNETLDSTFSTKDFRLDRAYAQWKPKAWDGMTMMFGKFGVPFYKPGKNELLFDGDLSPEGIAGDWRFALDKDTSAWVTAGGLWVEENAHATDVALFGVQAGLKVKLDDMYVLGGASYYGYNEVEGLSGLTASSPGNTAPLQDFDIIELFAEMGTKYEGTPVKVFFDYANNTGDSTGKDTAWLVGAQLGKAKKPGSWQVSYNYRDVEANATVGAVSDSDFIGGGTDGKGHEFGFKYAVAKNLFAGLTYFDNEKDPDGAATDFDRLQIDMVYKF